MAKRSITITPVLQRSNNSKECLNEKLWIHACLNGNWILLKSNHTVPSLNPASSIQHLVSSIHHPAPSIQYPASSIQHQPSMFLHGICRNSSARKDINSRAKKLRRRQMIESKISSKALTEIASSGNCMVGRPWAS